jgi:hypothetical protein
MPTPVADISAALAYQVKKEIAENYFGSRKVLEEEREDLTRQEGILEKAWEQEVLKILTQIYLLFIREEEGRAFLDLIKREDLIEPIKQSLKDQGINFSLRSCPLPFTLTAKGKYKNLIITLYQLARTSGDALGNEFQMLRKKMSLFNEELTNFTSCYNLSDILSLVHSFENRDDLKGVLGENTDPRAVPLLEEKLRLRPLELGQRGEALLRPLPPMKEIQKPLKLLIDLTFQGHGPEIKKMLGSFNDRRRIMLNGIFLS